MPVYPDYEVLEGSRIERFDERVIDRASNGAAHMRVMSVQKSRWTLVHQITPQELEQLIALSGHEVELKWPPVVGVPYAAIFSGLPEEEGYINPTTLEVKVKLEEV